MFSCFDTMPACDTHTHRQTRDHGYYPRVASAARVKSLVLSHPLGDLGVTHRVRLWLDGKRIVIFLLAIIKLFASSHG